MQSTRRSEARPEQLSYAVGDEDRASLSPRDGNRDEAWTTLGIDSEETRPTRHAFPYGVASPGLAANPASVWDYPLNVRALSSQIKASTAGRGVTTPERAGSDLAARIWSVKTWTVEGSFFGVDIEETWPAGSTLSVVSVGGSETRTETERGNRFGRQFAPTRISYIYGLASDVDGDDSSTNFSFSLTFPDGGTVDIDGGGYWFSSGQLGAGMSSGSPVLAPMIRGSLSYQVRDSSGDLTDNSLIYIQPERQAPLDDEEELFPVIEIPIHLCGYQLIGHEFPGNIGSLTGSIRIKASAFWGPGEWPA